MIRVMTETATKSTSPHTAEKTPALTAASLITS